MTTKLSTLTEIEQEIVYPDTDGLPRAHSPLLNLDLRWEEGRLRFYDPVSGRWLENNAESLARAEVAEARVEATEALAKSEREARIAAESRVAEMEAELRRLRGE